MQTTLNIVDFIEPENWVHFQINKNNFLKIDRMNFLMVGNLSLSVVSDIYCECGTPIGVEFGIIVGNGMLISAHRCLNCNCLTIFDIDDKSKMEVIRKFGLIKEAIMENWIAKSGYIQ